MMRLTDATRLASTKLRTRKIRLVVTIIVAGLLFSVLAAASQVSRGAFASVESFSREGFGSRYIVAGFALQDNAADLTTNPGVVTRALAIEKDIQSKKTAEAKRLGIPYDTKNDRPAISEFDTPGGKQKQINPDSPAAQQALEEQQAIQMAPGLPELQQAASRYGAEHYYSSRSLSFGPNAPSLAVMKDGKESYDRTRTTNGPPAQTGIDSFTQSWSLLSQQLAAPFMLHGASATVGTDGSVPLIAPYTAVEQLLKLKPLPASAKPAERLARLKEVRAQAQDIRFQVCYRNQTSSSLLEQAISQQQELTQHKADKDYQKPSLLYALPSQPCGPAIISSDTRTKDEKLMAAKQEQFDETFGKPAAAQQAINFRVIGIAPDPPTQSATAVSSLIIALLGSSLGPGTWYTPLELQEQAKVPVLSTIFKKSPTSFGIPDTYFAEFADADHAKRYIDQQTCQPDFSQQAGQAANNPIATCQKQAKYFSLVPFGSNSLALDQAQRVFSKYFGLAALAVAGVAVIIMICTIGRTIADSRRETAVFRAIGAKRFDIVQIYLIYTLFLSLLIFGFALAVGFAAATYVNAHYASEFTVQSLLAYNAQDLTRTFSLYRFYGPDMLRLLALSLAGGAVSASLPLLRNLRRSPIRDMRDDT